MGSNLGRTGRISLWSARRHWLVILAWILVAVTVTVLSGITGSRLTTDIAFSSKPDSQIARELLEEARGAEPFFEQVIVQSSEFTVDDPEFAAFVDEVVNGIRSLSGTVEPEQVFSYYDIGEEGLVSADRGTTIIPSLLVGDLDEATESVVVLEEKLHEFNERDDSFVVVTGGYASVNNAFGEASEGDLANEFKVMPFALLILIAVFGAVVAAVLPMVLAFVAIGVTFGLIALMSQLYEMSIFVSNVTLMIGMAVGIDYALLVVARFREQRRAGHDLYESIGIAGDTAARAVVFSGLTVVIALMGMFVVPTTIFRSFALGASTVALITIVASLTLLPAVLSLLGDRVNALRIPIPGNTEDNENSGAWATIARFVMRNPVPMAVGSAGLLIVLSIPYFSINLGASGTAALPERFDARQAFDILNDKFSAGRIQSTDIVIQADDVSSPEVQAGIASLLAALDGDQTYALINHGEVLRDDLALVQVAVPGDSASPEAVNAMKAIRSDIVPAAFAGITADVYVGGPTAGNSDFFDLVDTYTPAVFAFVLGFSFVLLTLIFRSIVVPVKSIIMNLLSVGASYGVVVATFQWGWGKPLGFTQVDSIEAWLPLFMFTILFGLSMDYHIFLLTRIRERFDETLNNTESVAYGLRHTANIITGAAAIMVAVFGGFALGELPMFQQIGVGLAVSVFLDATIVRTILVPATMRLLGNANWYMPGWLSWLPDLRVEREPVAVAVAPEPVAGGR